MLNFADLFRQELEKSFRQNAWQPSGHDSEYPSGQQNVPGGKYPENVLDIGCGDCPEGEQFLSRGIRFTGVDQDEETIRKVQERLPEGAFIAADAVTWMGRTDSRFDAILIRRPNLIFQSANWHRIFSRIPFILKDHGIVIVTTPGRSESAMCAKWLREAGGKVEVKETNIPEEGFLMKADDFHVNEEKEKNRENANNIENNIEDNNDNNNENDRSQLIQALSWDDQPHMVCDLRTGRCTTWPAE
ncbi:MAG: class I SAM-dependent methyltransferase [Bilifractor sp.]